MVKITKQNQTGFSTVEILIATAILVIVFSAVILLILGSQKLTTDTQVAHAGQLLSEKYLEEGRNLALVSFNTNQNYNGTSTSGSLVYTISRTQHYVSPCVKSITSRVDWTLEGRAQYTTATSQVTNPALVLQSGSECATTEPPSSAWDGCYQYSSADLPSSNYDAYDVAVARINGNKYLFMVGHPSSQNNPEDLWVYNINNIAIPTFVSKMDANQDAGTIGLNAIVVAKNAASGKYYAYMASDSNQNQLVVIDVSNPAILGTPVLRSVTGFGNNVKPTAIEYINDKVFLAIGSTVQAFDVTTPLIPGTPTAINIAGAANKLAVNSNYLFVASADNAGELLRVSLANYATQTKYDAPGNQDGTAVFLTGGTAYLGRTTQNDPDFLVLDISGITITALGSKDLRHQNNSNIVDIVISGPFAFVASTSSNKELEVYDTSNPNSITQKCLNPSVNPTNVGFGMTVFENYVYMAMRSNSELAVFADHQ